LAKAGGGPAGSRDSRTRKLTVLAQDPSVTVGSRVLTAEIPVPVEGLTPGPCGHRVNVIDYDSTNDRFYRPARGSNEDAYAGVTNPSALVSDPRFHQQNVYAIAMATLVRFEQALGRRVSWSFASHQLKIAPHAFAEANAFYSRNDEALVFGYFAGHEGTVFSCLSHDVVAHETTHALVDGLRERYMDPSSPDQAAFHEGFADIVALLSVFALKEVVNQALDLTQHGRKFIDRRSLTLPALRDGVLVGLAEQMGREMQAVRGNALRRSAKLRPSADYLNQVEFEEPHRRGEVLVAAMLNSFLEAWIRQIKFLGQVRPGQLDRAKVVEEGAAAADRLLTMAIRALDYAPSAHMSFGDFLSAMLTADLQVAPDDSRYRYRDLLRTTFASYGIVPASPIRGAEAGIWEEPEQEPDYTGSHFESLQRDPNEVFRFLWENRAQLGIAADPYTKVLSVRPTLRVGPDGFFVHETVAEYVQTLVVRAAALRGLGIRKPMDMPDTFSVHLHGGGALIFDEYGRLKYHVRNRLLSPHQAERLEYLWRIGAFDEQTPASQHFAAIHRQRAFDRPERIAEVW
jgi:hypothetical protein